MRVGSSVVLVLFGLLELSGCASGSGRRPGPLDAGPRLDGGPTIDAAIDATTPLDADGLDAAMLLDGGVDAGADGGHDAGLDAGSPDAGLPPACLSALEAARFTFESGAQGWSHAAMDGVSVSWPLDPWEDGAPSLGPASCAEGSRCFATDLDQNYAQCGRADLRSPTIDLRACAGREVVMVWEQWFDFWTGDYGGNTWFDGGLVELAPDGSSTWSAPSAIDTTTATVRINPNRGSSYACVSSTSFYVHGRTGFVGTSGGWQTTEARFGTQPTDSPFRVRFAWASGVSSSTTNANTSRSGTRPGWVVDHVRFELR